MAKSPPSDPDAMLRRAIEAGRSVKFGRGVVGKTSYAIFGLVALWTAIIARASASLVLDGVLIAAGLVATGAVIWWINATQRFAAENPAQAMLEGGELIEYQRYEAETKSGLRSGGALISDQSAIRVIGNDT
jgi:hypothetical protein